MGHDFPKKEASVKNFVEKANCRIQSFGGVSLAFWHQYPFMSWSQNAFGVDSDFC